MAVGTPSGAVSEANTTSTTAAASLETGSETGRAAFALGFTYREGGDITLSATFDVTAMDIEVSRVDNNSDFYYRTTLFRLHDVTGTETLTVTASTSDNAGVGMVACHVDGVENAAAEATATAEDLSSPHTVSIGAGVSDGSIVFFGGNFVPNIGTMTGLTASGCTEIGQATYEPAYTTTGGLAFEIDGDDAGGFTHDGAGTFAATMVAASFAAASATAYTLTADGDSYAWTGQAANLEYHSVIEADGDTYAWSPQDVTFSLAVTLAAEGTSYTWSPQDVILLHTAIMAADGDSYAWTGQTLSLEYHSEVQADGTSYTWTVGDVAFAYAKALAAEAAVYSWSPQDVNFSVSFLFEADGTSYTWTGAAATLDHDIDLQAGNQYYVKIKERPSGPWRITQIIFESVQDGFWTVKIWNGYKWVPKVLFFPGAA